MMAASAFSPPPQFAQYDLQPSAPPYPTHRTSSDSFEGDRTPKPGYLSEFSGKGEGPRISMDVDGWFYEVSHRSVTLPNPRR